MHVTLPRCARSVSGAGYSYDSLLPPESILTKPLVLPMGPRMAHHDRTGACLLRHPNLGAR
ncbi:hypothetical protein MLPF_0341 [Mycobacterium lepromatosis]|nr:hypothetical protein MLPF_0341 [Mycobacterium lepromatosis]